MVPRAVFSWVLICVTAEAALVVPAASVTVAAVPSTVRARVSFTPKLIAYPPAEATPVPVPVVKPRMALADATAFEPTASPEGAPDVRPRIVLAVLLPTTSNWIDDVAPVEFEVITSWLTFRLAVAPTRPDPPFRAAKLARTEAAVVAAPEA